MVFNGVAPSMAELAQLYIAADFVFQATYLLTAPREYLIKRASDRNMAPYPATAAVYRAEFNREVPEGTRFACEDVNFVVTGRMDPEDDTETGLSHRVTCEKVGAATNQYTGQLIPVEYLDGLTRAELVELLVPGEDEEETEAFRQRVLESFQTQAFGGNQADYREQVLAMPGVGGVKVHPVWNENLRPAEFLPNAEVQAWVAANLARLPQVVAAWLRAVYTAAADKLLTVGGTVRLVLLAADGSVPTAELIEQVQELLDPEQNAGEGLGLAPIGHVVKVEGVQAEAVNLELHLTYNPGWDWESARSYVEAVLDAYFAELAESWAEAEFLMVRISQIESRILAGCATMLADIGGTKINGREANLPLGPDSIPERGDLIG